MTQDTCITSKGCSHSSSTIENTQSSHTPQGNPALAMVYTHPKKTNHLSRFHMHTFFLLFEPFMYRKRIMFVRGVRRCFWMRGLTLWAIQPTQGVWEHTSLGNVWYVYALKSILGHSETKYHKYLTWTHTIRAK